MNHQVRLTMREMTQEDSSPQFAPRANQEPGIVLQLADGTIAACNAVAQEILGMTVDQLRDTSAASPWQTIHPDGTPFPGETHPAMVAIRTGQPCSDVKMGFYQPNGELIWLNLDAQPLFKSSEGTPYAATVTVTRLTKVRENAIADSEGYANLRDSEIWYRLLSEAIPQLVWVTTADGRNEYVNRQFCEFTGLSEADLLNLNWIEIIHPEDRDRTIAIDGWHRSVAAVFTKLSIVFDGLMGRIAGFWGRVSR